MAAWLMLGFIWVAWGYFIVWITEQLSICHKVRVCGWTKERAVHNERDRNDKSANAVMAIAWPISLMGLLIILTEILGS